MGGFAPVLEFNLAQSNPPPNDPQYPASTRTDHTVHSGEKSKHSGGKSNKWKQLYFSFLAANDRWYSASTRTDHTINLVWSYNVFSACRPKYLKSLFWVCRWWLSGQDTSLRHVRSEHGSSVIVWEPLEREGEWQKIEKWISIGGLVDFNWTSS